ncbi:plastocyanin/azurin family copper-binding protein [Sinorhizobium meliloti]|nr:plastocyanin/azurin family copper-binding protein [Sinorhizobium meliloti]
MPTQHTVEIRQFRYDPQSISIHVGDSVKWINRDSVNHTATRAANPAFDTGPIAKDASSAEIIFDQTSDSNGFEYICTPHPVMKGRVVVS